MGGRVLVFPAGMPKSLAFLEQALQDGYEIIGSSSLRHDPAKVRYPLWCHLPFVTDDAFNDKLRMVVQTHSIDRIYTPNIVVWNYLDNSLGDICPGVSLLNESPLENEVLPYRNALDFAKHINRCPMEIGVPDEPRPLLDDLRVASIFHHSEQIPGMCDHDKIRALFSIFRYCPPGDVVEIGSWWGKSAFVIASLAKSYVVGNILCVDPWSIQHVKQGDQKGLVDSVAIDTEQAYQIFQINLMSFFGNTLNYLRLPSGEASVVFRRQQHVASRSFGETRYTGEISVLHIDGNHSYDSVKVDIDAWVDMVLPGGWIIFDDYIWPYGDGPKKAADEYMDERSRSIDLAFVMGSALFLRKLI